MLTYTDATGQQQVREVLATGSWKISFRMSKADLHLRIIQYINRRLIHRIALIRKKIQGIFLNE